ncbi:unnamed protein product [Rotaria magnacalcarata]|uniref:Uncharacterized protein n=1 Tax=Rotaria magnacalcarata TaxID=392030 RepID=A0A820BIB7_9BILA|nr:unnamed protein product [Rotaria magnacalcarata]CAF3943580.1 unnamed protein product [Rotaria magnacalcarata]CAF3959300.1 unnamed protein product [Rotaria magnacalcarata]CAF4143534.1 unnamed protein product [Rotaria magnacalcarata]CAF4207742.1 unnamed protein product [Rotaria magnacalcarata]
MATSEGIHKIDTVQLLSILNNEEELIVKPRNFAHGYDTGGVECGRIVSRVNKTLFDYRIGDKAVLSRLPSIFNRRIVLLNPITKEAVIEFYHKRLPLLFKACYKQDSVFFYRLAFGKVWYDVYDGIREHIASLALRKSHIRSKIQHRVPEVLIFDKDETKDIGHIYPFSTDLERSEYGNAVAMKIPHNLPVETKAILLIATLMIKSRVN